MDDGSRCVARASRNKSCCVLQELLNTSVTTVLYLIAFIVQLSVHSTPYYISIRDRNIAAGVGTHISRRYLRVQVQIYCEVGGSQTPPLTEDGA